MSKVTVRYSFEWSRAPKPASSFCCYVSDEPLFLALRELGLVTNKPFRPEETYVRYSVQTDESDPIHAHVWALFRKHGIDLDKVPGFRPSRVRHYEDDEYDQFELLSLRPDKLASIAEFAENRDGVHVLKANARLKNKVIFGSVEHTRVFYASEEGCAQLARQHLIGIAWEPVVFDHLGKAAKKLFRLRSSVTMPECQTVIVDARYIDIKTLSEAEIVARDWYDGGYRPPEMTFRRGEVEALGQFDVALTREVVGSFPRWYRPEVIVTQRFRQVLRKMKNADVGFNPVHLV